MNLLVHMQTGVKAAVRGDFRGVQEFAPKVIGPIIELDSKDPKGNREWLVVDPRALVLQQLSGSAWEVVYNPRQHMEHFSDTMTQTMKNDPTWPQRILSSLS
jgi:hypothetical protein